MSPLFKRGHVRARQTFCGHPEHSTFNIQHSTTNKTMSDNPTPAPAPAAKTPKHHGLLDKHQLAEISHTNTIYGIANDPATFAKIQDD
jgi:hypothetical protein